MPSIRVPRMLALIALVSAMADARVAAADDEVVRVTVPHRPDAYVVEPKSDGAQPLVLVLHARNGDPEEDCRKWATVAAAYGWVLCPAGPVPTDNGHSWGRYDEAKKAIDEAIEALRAKYGARVRSSGNLVIGFSEGALVAQNLGLFEPERWSRWLILGGSDKYWGDSGPELLRAQRRKIARVVLITGEHDAVLEHSLRAGGMIRDAHIPVRVIVRRGLGHDVPADRMAQNFAPSLRWLFESKSP